MAFSCTSEEEPSPVKETVDQSYLDSEAYQQFKEQTTQEQTRSPNQNSELETFIRNRITINAGQALNLPAEIDAEMVESILQKYRKNPPALVEAFGGRKRYYPIAKINRSSLNYDIFMLCEVAAYENCLLMLATSREGRVSDMETIGVFNRSLSYRADSRIKITETRVKAEMTKTVLNPFEQTNTVSEAYQISDMGKIDQIKN